MNQTTNIHDDETRIDNINQGNSRQQQGSKTAANDAAAPKAVAHEKGNDMAKRAGIGSFGVIAGVVGSGVAAFMHAHRIVVPIHHTVTSESGHETEDHHQETETGEHGTTEPPSLDNVQLAHTPDDNMSFNAAFDAAREEVGPNGVFEWRGGEYSTCYTNEWDKLPDEYKEQFTHHNWQAQFSSASPAEDNSDVPHPENTSDHSAISDHPIQTDADGHEYVSLTNAITGDEVRIDPDQLDHAILDSHGQLLGITGEDVSLVAVDGTHQQGHYEPDESGIWHLVSDDADAHGDNGTQTNDPDHIAIGADDHTAQSVADDTNQTVHHEPNDNGDDIHLVSNDADDTTTHGDVAHNGTTADDQVEVPHIIDGSDNEVEILNSQDAGNHDEPVVPDYADGHHDDSSNNMGEHYDIAVLDDNNSSDHHHDLANHDDTGHLADLNDDGADNGLHDYDNHASVDDFTDHDV